MISLRDYKFNSNVSAYALHKFTIFRRKKNIYQGEIMKKFMYAVCLLSCVFLITSCASTQKNANTSTTDNISVGKVQREIKIGMTSAEVVEVLGSPNIVTTDEERREVWVYDKISTQIDSSSSSKGIWLVVIGAGSEKNKYSSSQRTLTIIIKFDKENKVRDFSYRTSSF